MYILVKKINSGEFDIVNNKLLYSYHQQLYFDDEIIYNGNPTSFKTFKSTAFIIDNFEKLIVLNLKNKNKKEFDFIKGISLIINENDIIYGYYSDDYTAQYRTRINLETNEKKWTIESYFGNGEILENYLYASCTNNRICKIDLDNPEHPIWQFNLNQFGTYRQAGDDLAYEVVQFIGIWQNLILVQLTNARLIALDINTGELLQDIEINKTNPLTGVFYDTYIKMHLVDDKIIWLTNQTLIHINLISFTPEIIKEYYSLPKENQWRFMHNTYHNGKIYFTADYAWQYVTPSYVGVMEAQTGNVLWSEQLKNTGGLPEAPKVTDDKLYIRTNNKELHIFGKEPTPSL